MGRMSEETPKAEDAKVEEAVQEVAVEETAKEEAAEAAPVAEEATTEKKETPTEPRELAQPSDDFDWDAINDSDDTISEEERAKLEELYSANLTLIEDKQVVTGTVVTVGKKEIVVNIGYKSEGVISASEFRYNPDLKPGDSVAVFVEKQEDANGQLVVSHRTARVYEAWGKINQAKDEDLIIQGVIKTGLK